MYHPARDFHQQARRAGRPRRSSSTLSEIRYGVAGTEVVRINERTG
jgi:hypothetical protein